MPCFRSQLTIALTAAVHAAANPYPESICLSTKHVALAEGHTQGSFSPEATVSELLAFIRYVRCVSVCLIRSSDEFSVCWVGSFSHLFDFSTARAIGQRAVVK